MSKQEYIAASPLSGKVYLGTPNATKSAWSGNKTDVTEMTCRAVVDHLYHTKKSKVYRLPDGREVMLRIDLIDKE